MHRILLIILACGIIPTFLNATGLTGRSGPLGGSLRGGSALKGEDVEFLDTLFAPYSVPQANIPVLEKALGDIVHDSVVNVLDLLRLRDVVTGRPPSPTPFELQKGDLNQDGKVDAQDLYILRDILLRKIGVPYLIDLGGGKVGADGITLTIPPGGLDSAIIISIRRYGESEFTSALGLDTKSALEDSAYFMAGYEILSNSYDFKLPADATIKLDQIPPCAYQGLNGQFAAVPDRDGDGKSELFLMNELNVNKDSLTLTTGKIPVPHIQNLSPSQAEPGQSFLISGSGFGKDAVSLSVIFVSSAHTDSAERVPASFVDDTTLLVRVPGSPLGQCNVSVFNLLTGLKSNPAQFEIMPPGPVAGDIRSIIVNFKVSMAHQIDSLGTDTLYKNIEDTTVRNYVASVIRENRAMLDSDITYFSMLPDSVIPLFAPVAAFIQNMTTDQLAGYYRSIHQTADNNRCEPCKALENGVENVKDNLAEVRLEFAVLAGQCMAGKPLHECAACISAQWKAKKYLDYTDWLAEQMTELVKCECAHCTENCGECFNTVFVGYGSQRSEVIGGFTGGSFGTKGCCINIIRYKSNECVQLVNVPDPNPIPDNLLSALECSSIYPEARFESRSIIETTYGNRVHAGSIVKVTNAPVPYNIVGLVNGNGRAFIPQVPMGRKVTFSIYDPVTGLYDPDAGTYTTGSKPGGFDRPLLLFMPNTNIRRTWINIGEEKQDSVWLDWQRIDYLLKVTAADTSRSLNIGFSSDMPLALRIEEPEGGLVLDTNSSSCILSSPIKLKQVGTYTLRVAYGINTNPVAFSIGVKEHPSLPIDKFYMCGRFVNDTLYEILSPYVFEDPATIQKDDSVFVEAGVSMHFGGGGWIISNGVMEGSGTHQKPIILQPAVMGREKPLSQQIRAVRPVPSAGKEVPK